jgi:lipopolysaccharide transport system ATP-binding protein
MSSNDIAIKVENISKRYRIGLKETVHETFGGVIIDLLKSPLKNYKKYRSLYKFDEDSSDSGKDFESPDIIWALRDVSFEVNREQVIGVIGKNGSGKSTLLKILSKITDPTSGCAEIRGRVSSLLEVGTGFNPELTGRENVYLNGSILGMKKNEIKQKFDEIIDFSGVDKFIDTPVKRYSSGMLVRLAFAVAAHLEPEILIVDEVLAVGDAEFQKKCLGKMGDLAKGGRTVLLVSHNLGAITDLCTRTLWLDEGRLILDGRPMDVVTKYLSLAATGQGYWAGNTAEQNPGRHAWLRSARVLSNNGNKTSTTVRFDEQVKIEIEYEIKIRTPAFRSYLFFRDSRGTVIWSSHDTDGSNKAGYAREPGIYQSTCIFPERFLRPGRYLVSIGIFGNPRETVEEEHIDVLSFDISEAGYIFNRDPRMGVITPCLNWNVTVREGKKENQKN